MNLFGRRSAKSPGNREEGTGSSHNEPLYRHALAVAVRHPDGGEVVYNAERRIETAVGDVSDFARRCVRFATLDSHAEQIASKMSLPTELVLGQLREAAKIGLLWRHDELIARACERAVDDAAPKIERLVVLTCRRPESLRRCLESHVGALERHERSVEIVVSDDATESEGGEAEELANKTQYAGEVVSYLGRAKRRQFADRLGANGVPPYLVEFALFGDERIAYTHGANCNALLLDSVGRAFVCVDDDVVGEFGPLPDAEPGLGVVSDGYPSEVWFHPDRAAARDSVAFEDADPLAYHEQLLGRSVDSAIADHRHDPGAVDLNRASQTALRQLARGEGRVRVTQLGIVGDSGMSWPAAFLRRPGASAVRLYEALDDFGWSRELVRGSLHSTVCDAPILMTYHVGFDATQLLPPFFPVLRNADGLFAQALRRCIPDSRIGHLPWVVLHEPPEPRPIRHDEVERAYLRLRFSDLLPFVFDDWSPSPGQNDPAERMRSLGRHLHALKGTAIEDFEAFLLDARWRQRAKTIEALERVLLRADSPTVINALQVAIDSTIEGLQSDDSAVPIDIPDELGDKQRKLEITRDWMTLYGELLIHWPDIWDFARR